MSTDHNPHTEVLLGQWTNKGLDALLRRAARIHNIPDRIELISRQYLDVPYGVGTLVGSSEVPEVLVANLRAVDCFTYLDYVEAMRLSGSFDVFIESLKQVRYQSGVVSYETRKHFFSDWVGSNRIIEITEDIGGKSTKRVLKKLNVRSDGSHLLPGVSVTERTILSVPSTMAPAVSAKLQTGDYVGMYTDIEGLDVSHVGLIARSEDGVKLRHASLVQGRVVEENFETYAKGKPGFMVLRPLP
jgi:hypothetical protein